MSAPIDIPPPLTCGACGALVDERQAWHRWPHHVPPADGDYLVMMQAPDTMVYQSLAYWRREYFVWRLYSDWNAADPWPIAWRHVPPLPEWVQ